MRSDSRTHDGSGSVMIIVFPVGREYGSEFFRDRRGFRYVEAIGVVIPVACGKFPVVAGQAIFRRGQGTFLARAAIFFGRVGNSPSMTGVTKSSRVSRGNIP